MGFWEKHGEYRVDYRWEGVDGKAQILVAEDTLEEAVLHFRRVVGPGAILISVSLT